MKEIKGIFIAFAAMLLAYFRRLLIPVTVLSVCMLLDYCSGMAAAWYAGELNSEIGKRGALKKVCYMFLIPAAGVVDWLLRSGLTVVGIGYTQSFFFGTMVAVWLILNEMISILENCTKIGVPVPSFLKPIMERLKLVTERRCREDDDRDELSGEQ